MKTGNASKNRMWIWWVLLSVVVLTFALTWWLLTSGDRGAAIADVLGLPVAVVSLVVGVFGAFLGARGSGASPSGPPWWIPELRPRHVAVTGVVLALFAVGGWLYTQWADVEVGLGGPFLISATSTRTIVAQIEQPRWRGDLEFGVLMTSDNKTGDCVQPASLRIKASADARWLEDHGRTARTGERVSIPIPEGTRVVKVFVEYLDPANQGCEVTATLTGGTLSR
ncbi:hypothetical protein AB0M43_12915 [Longispora sp. NPDC051575]|uniref:hypothetical protein n=1 Tax=Longispora sp. NPDC051575 TaxID=3154943 RepID=UPI003436EC98